MIYINDYPFRFFKKEDALCFIDIFPKFRNKTPWIDGLLNSHHKVNVRIYPFDENGDLNALYADGEIYMNFYSVNQNSEKRNFQVLMHEYIHFLQDLNSLEFSPKSLFREDYKNIKQDFILCMLVEADAYTKENLLFEKNLDTQKMTQTFYLYLDSLVSKVNNLFDYQDLFNCATMDKRYQFTKTDFDVFWEKTLASGTKLNGGAFPEYNLDFSIVKNTIETAITENTIYETLKTVYGYSDDILRKKLLKNPAKYTDNDAEDWTGKLCDMYLDAKPKMLKFIQKNPKNSYEKNMAKVVKKQIIANFSDYR